jgi:hypothetical protein
MRSAEPILNPTVYAEDGAWTGMAMEHGWFHTIMNARADYKVLLNVLMLWVSFKGSYLFTGNHIEAFPIFIAIFSYSFFGALSALSYVATANYLNKTFRTILFVLTMLIPLGVTNNEIIGRALQIGFFLPYAAILLIMIRARCLGILTTVLIDFLLFSGTLTNPVVGIIVLIYAATFAAQHKSILASIKSIGPLCMLIMIYTVYITSTVTVSSSIRVEWVGGNAIEAMVARSILFPFIFSIYQKLNNASSIAFLIIFLGFIAYALWCERKNRNFFMLLFCLAALVAYTALTFKMRPGLTGLLSGYTGTFPDRYFVGINLIALLCLLFSFSIIYESGNKSSKVLTAITTTLICSGYLLKPSAIFDFGMPKMGIYDGQTYKQRICTAKKTMDGRFSVVPIEPVKWSMAVSNGEIHKVRCE